MARSLFQSLLLLAAATSVAEGAYLGLRNQGNTCYMNSLLQALHHIPEFRDAIYSIPTTADGGPLNADAFASHAVVLLLFPANRRHTVFVPSSLKSIVVMPPPRFRAL